MLDVSQASRRSFNRAETVKTVTVTALAVRIEDEEDERLTLRIGSPLRGDRPSSAAASAVFTNARSPRSTSGSRRLSLASCPGVRPGGVRHRDGDMPSRTAGAGPFSDLLPLRRARLPRDPAPHPLDRGTTRRHAPTQLGDEGGVACRRHAQHRALDSGHRQERPGLGPENGTGRRLAHVDERPTDRRQARAASAIETTDEFRVAVRNPCIVMCRSLSK